MNFGYGFDYQIQKKADVSDIDADGLYAFLEIANSVRNINENLLLPPDIILQKLDLILFTKHFGRLRMPPGDGICSKFR